MDATGVVLSVLCGLMASAIWCAIDRFWNNRNRLAILVKTKLMRDKPVRISAAYLFRIIVKGRYLLIRGGRIATQFQPVGGVYKYFESSSGDLNRMGVSPDDKMKTAKTDPKDLRVQLPAKNVTAFLDWFDSKKGREVAVLREFNEELVAEGYLPEYSSEGFSPEFIKGCERKLAYSTYLGIDEILVHDIFEIHLTEEEQSHLEELVSSNPSCGLALVDKDDIDKGTFSVGNQFYTIAVTARKVL